MSFTVNPPNTSDWRPPKPGGSAPQGVAFRFDTEEVVFRSPLPSDGLQRRFTSPTVQEWVCFAPGYPAWEMVAGMKGYLA